MPDAEPVPDRRDRGLRVIEEAMLRHRDHDVLLMVTHGGILQHFLAALMGSDRTWGLAIENTALFDFSVDLEQWPLDGDARLNTPSGASTASTTHPTSRSRPDPSPPTPIPDTIPATNISREGALADYTAYLNGDWVPLSSVKIDPMDRGFMLADVVFDVARSFNGKSFRMKEHVDRLYRSLQYTRLDAGLSADEMLDVSEEALRRNEPLRADVGDYTIRQFVTRGHGNPAWKAVEPVVCVRVAPIDFGWFAHGYDTGVHSVITKTRSYSPDALDPKIKHHSRMNFNMAELEAHDVDAEAYPILTDDQGNLTEGTGYNVFMVTDGVIRTPGDRSILQGVSRGMVLDLADQLDIPVVEEDLQPYDLYTCDEAFFSTTSPCVLPVTEVDHRQIGDGKPGPVSKQLLAAWSEAVGVDVVDQAQRFGGR